MGIWAGIVAPDYGSPPGGPCPAPAPEADQVGVISTVIKGRDAMRARRVRLILVVRVGLGLRRLRRLAGGT